MRKRWKQVFTTMNDTRDLMDLIERRMETMQTILMVREPSSPVAAEAYDGLRKQVNGAMSERLAHLAQLVQISTALDAGVDGSTMRRMVDGWLEASSLVRLTSASPDDFDRLFELVEDHGGELEVIEPAYVDAVTGRVIRLGRARRRPLPVHEPERIPEPEEVSEQQEAPVAAVVSAGRAEPAPDPTTREEGQRA